MADLYLSPQDYLVPITAFCEGVCWSLFESLDKLYLPFPFICSLPDIQGIVADWQQGVMCNAEFSVSTAKPSEILHGWKMGKRYRRKQSLGGRKVKEELNCIWWMTIPPGKTKASVLDQIYHFIWEKKQLGCFLEPIRS